MEAGWLHVAAGALGAWVVVLIARRLAAARRRLRARRRMGRARRGEVLAEDLLAERGFRVLERQAELTWRLPTSAGPVKVDLRADLIVARRRKRYVAEVKTGQCAPSLSSSRTRRQLLEYATAYDVDGALLVDPEGGNITEVFFRPERPSRLGALVLVAATLAAAAVWILLS